MKQDETNNNGLEANEAEKSVTTLSHIDNDLSPEQRKHRAIVLDAKLNDALLESFTCMAEIVDAKLYKELGYGTAREYFQDKSLEVRQVYRFAQIGRAVNPYLNESKHTDDVSKIGVMKLEQIVRHLDDQVPSMMTDGKIELGDEEYSVEELNEISYRQFKDEIKKANKKLQDLEVEKERRKNAELERDHLKKEVDKMEERDAKYRERSEKEDQIEQDLNDAAKALEKLQVLMTRIDENALPERLEFQAVALIDEMPTAHENLSEKFADILFKHNDVV